MESKDDTVTVCPQTFYPGMKNCNNLKRHEQLYKCVGG